MFKKTRSALFAFLLLPLALGACQTNQSPTKTENSQSQPSQPQPDLLSQVQKRGRLNCGINGSVKGLSYVNDEGKYSGFDVDICRAVAAGIL